MEIPYHYKGFAGYPRRCGGSQRGADLISRYTREEMGRVWSDANKYARWLDVELAATETRAEAGQVPKEGAATIRAKAKVSTGRGNEIETRGKHNQNAVAVAVCASIAGPP